MSTSKKGSTETPTAIDLRDRIKSIVDSELVRLPETLESLTAKERLDIILKLMPLIVPRSKPVHFREGESSPWNFLR